MAEGNGNVPANGQNGDGKKPEIHAEKKPVNKGIEHPAFQAHIFKPGQSGNPKGRPKRKLLSECVYEELQAKFPGMPEVTKMELLAKLIVSEALRGKFAFVKEAWDRLEGNVPLDLRLTRTERKEADVTIRILQDDIARGLASRLAQRISGPEGVAPGGNGEPRQ